MYTWRELYAHLMANNVIVNVNTKTNKAIAYIPNPGGGLPELTETIHIHGKGEFDQNLVDKICNNLGIPKMQ